MMLPCAVSNDNTFILFQYIFDYKEGEVFACVSDLGWIAAHTYVVYGPLCNGATTVLFEGTATYPDSGELCLQGSGKNSCLPQFFHDWWVVVIAGCFLFVFCGV